MKHLQLFENFEEEGKQPDGNVEHEGKQYTIDKDAPKFSVGDLVATENWHGEVFIGYIVKKIGHIKRSTDRFAEVYFFNANGKVDSNNLGVVGNGTGWSKLKPKE